MRYVFYFVGFLICFEKPAMARVFNIARENVAPYFSLSGGGVQLATSSLDGEAGAGITYSGMVNYNYTVEFGAVYSHEAMSLRFGFEVMKPFALSSIANNGTEDLYSAQSELVGYTPKVGLELTLNSTQTTRSLFTIYAGSASLSMKNSYVLTSAGQAAFAGVVNHSVDTKSTSTLTGAALGVEGLFTDSTTLLFEFGYRKLEFDNITYAADVATFGGSQAAGAKVLKYNGDARKFDFAGAYASIGFRFYF